MEYAPFAHSVYSNYISKVKRHIIDYQRLEERKNKVSGKVLIEKKFYINNSDMKKSKLLIDILYK